MDKVNIKTPEEIGIMREGGEKLSRVKRALMDTIAEGVSAEEIEKLAQKMIKESGGKPSFQMVPGYHWATCVNVNDGVVHGIPKKELVFKKGDVVSIDVGMYYKSFHTDTSSTKLIGRDEIKENFLHIGAATLKKAIASAKVGKTVGDISKTIENTLVSSGYTPIRSLTGHGVGRNLHEDPRIPCFVANSSDERMILQAGMALAIEVMYTEGSESLILDEDGWTIRTKDGKIAALFEETVALESNGPSVLTA